MWEDSDSDLFDDFTDGLDAPNIWALVVMIVLLIVIGLILYYT